MNVVWPVKLSNWLEFNKHVRSIRSVPANKFIDTRISLICLRRRKSDYILEVRRILASIITKKYSKNTSRAQTLHSIVRNISVNIQTYFSAQNNWFTWLYFKEIRFSSLVYTRLLMNMHKANITVTAWRLIIEKQLRLICFWPTPALYFFPCFFVQLYNQALMNN